MLGLLGALAAANAGHVGEDSIRDVWLSADRGCQEEYLAGTEVKRPADFVIPAAMEWNPDHWYRDCE